VNHLPNLCDGHWLELVAQPRTLWLLANSSS
jgi:hypothetical protein